MSECQDFSIEYYPSTSVVLENFMLYVLGFMLEK